MRYARGEAPKPREYEALELVDRFGAAAVYGRPLGVGELRRLHQVERIIRSYRDRARAKSRVDWNEDHPADALMLYKLELELTDVED